MNFSFNTQLVENYHSSSQKIRILSEDWTERNLYCPICGRPYISRYENNHPTGDFYCNNCSSDFELKSKEKHSARPMKTIVDGEYLTMISRITSFRNPNFFFMTYNNYEVTNFLLIPNHFFTPSIIIKRNPLRATAKRAGWIGCNIDISSIPDTGKIFIVKNQEEINHDEVIQKYAKTKTLLTKNLEARGWLLDTLKCVDKISDLDFTLNQIYDFEEELKQKHPDNNFIKDKLRQQLQILRDKGYIEFTRRGHYKKII